MVINYSVVKVGTNERNNILGLYRDFIQAFLACKRYSAAGINSKIVSLNPIIDVKFNISKKGDIENAK